MLADVDCVKEEIHTCKACILVDITRSFEGAEVDLHSL